MKSRFRLTVLCVVFGLMLIPNALVSAEPVNVAVLDLENLNRDPRYDYLEGMIIGVLMYDLIRVDNVKLVERALLDRIIDEQGLRLTGLLSDADTARQVGQLAGADYLIGGDYAFLGRDMNVNLKLMSVNEGTIIPFSRRGYTENMIHSLAENIVEELIGEPIIFAGTDGERSMLSLSDEEPGSIEFYCNFENGEILVDEEFYGYTPGGVVPTLLEDLSPGEHTIRVEAGNNFGEIDWPEVNFRDWERTVTVKAGRKSVLRARVYHFNSLIYDAMELYDEDWRLGKGYEDPVRVQQDVSFVDRSGRRVPVSLELDAEIVDGEILTSLTVEADGLSRTWNLESELEEINIEETLGVVDIDFEREWSEYYGYWEMDLDLERNDLYQGMHWD